MWARQSIGAPGHIRKMLIPLAAEFLIEYYIVSIPYSKYNTKLAIKKKCLVSNDLIKLLISF